MIQDKPLVSLHNVHKYYGRRDLVLSDINIDVYQGEFIGLIGPSGCGKTTLLKVIAGLSPASAGNLRIMGRTPERARRHMAYIFQDATLQPWLTVARNIQMGMRLRGINKSECVKTAGRMMELVELSKVADYHPRQLSGGMKMRVSIARALALSPQIMLLDEPFGALDAMSRNRLNEELLRIRAQEAWTAFFVTHSVAEAVFLSDRILIMSHLPGHIIHEVKVDLPHPRTSQTRESIEFQRLTVDVARLLPLRKP